MSDEDRTGIYGSNDSPALKDRVEQRDGAASVRELPEILEIDYEVGSKLAASVGAKRGAAAAYLGAIDEKSHRVCICPKVVEDLRSAEKEEGRAGSELERCIEVRTAQLRTLNDLLKREREERMRAEDALRAGEARFKIAARCASDILYEWDFSSDRMVWYGDVDSALGYEPDEFPRTFEAWEEAMHPEDHDRVISAVRDHILKEKPFQVQYRIRCKDGSYVHWSGRGVALRDEEGNPHTWIGAGRDVTRELQMQLRLCEARKMEAMTTLAEGFAHDFTNILGVISGYSDLALHSSPGDELGSRSLLKVKSACNRARDLIRHALTFATPSTGERSSLQIGPIVEETLKRFEASLPSTIEVEKHLETGSDFVLAHRGQLRQIILNLCTNAVHAMKDKGGTLEVFLDQETFYPGEARPHPDLLPGSYVLLTVKDTGHGMNTRTLERIFEPYFTTKEKGEGRGLGLSIVHGLVRSCGGAVIASSEPGCGSAFKVYLPRIEPAPEGSTRARRQLPGGSERILVVDNDQQLLDVSCRMLEFLGYKVSGVTSGNDALRVFETEPGGFDLIIASQAMPRLTGTLLAEKLLEIRCGVPIILTVEYGEGPEAEKSSRAGISDLLSKPLEMEDLARRVRQVLDRAAACRRAKEDAPPEFVVTLQWCAEQSPMD